MTITEIENRLVSILRNHDASRISVFGSYSRGEAGPESDLDVLVNFSTRKSLLSLVRIERELSVELGIKVDLLTEGAISPHLIDSIKSDSRVLYQ
jgi:hypothetical protein